MEEEILQAASEISQPESSKITIRKFFDVASWSALFLLAPFTILILLSQNSVPGDFFYPIKRGMENVVLAAASVSPAAKVAFRTNLTERRFSEAEKLLLAKSDTTALDDFVQEVAITQEAVATLSDPTQKQESTKTLVNKIEEYQTKLTQLQQQVQRNAPPPQTAQPQQPNQNPLLLTATLVPPTAAPTTIPPQSPVPSRPGQPPVTVQPSPTPPLAAVVAKKNEELEKIKEKAKKELEERGRGKESKQEQRHKQGKF